MTAAIDDDANHATLMQGAERERARDLASRITHALSTAGFHNAALAIITATRETRTVDAVREAVQKNCSRDVLSSLSESMRGEIGVGCPTPELVASCAAPVIHIFASMVRGCAASRMCGAEHTTTDPSKVTCPECAKAWAERPGQTVVVPSPKAQNYTCGRCGVDGPMINGLVGGVYCLNVTACLARPALDKRVTPEMVAARVAHNADPQTRHGGQPVQQDQPPKIATGEARYAAVMKYDARIKATGSSDMPDLPAVKRADYSSEPLPEMLGGEMAVTAGEPQQRCVRCGTVGEAFVDGRGDAYCADAAACLERPDLEDSAPSQSEIARLTERCEVFDATIRNQAAAIRDRCSEIVEWRERAERADANVKRLTVEHADACGDVSEWERLAARHANTIAMQDALLDAREKEIAALRDENNSLRQDCERLTTERITVKQEVDYWKREFSSEVGVAAALRATASAERATSAADLTAALVAVSDWRTLSECWKHAAHALAAESDEHERSADKWRAIAGYRRRDCDALSNQLANIAHEVGATARPDDAVRDLVRVVVEYRSAELSYRFVSDMPDPGGAGMAAFDRLRDAKAELMRVGEAVGGFKGILHGVAAR